MAFTARIDNDCSEMTQCSPAAPTPVLRRFCSRSLAKEPFVSQSVLGVRRACTASVNRYPGSFETVRLYPGPFCRIRLYRQKLVGPPGAPVGRYPKVGPSGAPVGHYPDSFEGLSSAAIPANPCPPGRGPDRRLLSRFGRGF